MKYAAIIYANFATAIYNFIGAALTPALFHFTWYRDLGTDGFVVWLLVSNVTVWLTSFFLVRRWLRA